MIIERIFDEVKDELQCQPVGIPLPLAEHVDDYKAACPACNLTFTGKSDEQQIGRTLQRAERTTEEINRQTRYRHNELGYEI